MWMHWFFGAMCIDNLHLQTLAPHLQPKLQLEGGTLGLLVNASLDLDIRIQRGA